MRPASSLNSGEASILGSDPAFKSVFQPDPFSSELKLQAALRSQGLHERETCALDFASERPVSTPLSYQEENGG